MTLCEPKTEPELITHELDLPEEVPPLSTFYLYLTSGCNLRCRHCWITPRFVDGEPSPGETLSLELLRSAIEQARPLGLSGAKLTGGEPMLHPQFVQIVDLLTAEGIRTHMETNGTLIDAALARHLREETSLWFISISIDGPTAQIHDAFRGVEGSFEAAVRGFRHLVEAGYQPQLIMSPHRGNVNYVEEVVDLAIELGAGSIKFNPVTRSGRGIAMHERNEALDVVEILELAHFVRGELQERSPIRLTLATPPALYTVGELIDWGTDQQCHVRHILGILGSGDMALCGVGQNIPELCFGNLEDTGVREVWLHHPVLRQLRQELEGRYPGLCGDCIHAQRCLTHCVAQNYVDAGQLVVPHTLCAAAHEQGLFPAGRLRDDEAV
jgi:SynChlorMet cassette radical SAM/SPASM protein ScmF